MPFDTYFKTIEKQFTSGQATEHSYRSALEALVHGLGSNLSVINEPRQIDCGAPDLIVKMGAAPLGYIEAKDIGKDLDFRYEPQER